MNRYYLKKYEGTQFAGYRSAYAAYKDGVPLRMIDPREQQIECNCEWPMAINVNCPHHSSARETGAEHG